MKVSAVIGSAVLLGSFVAPGVPAFAAPGVPPVGTVAVSAAAVVAPVSVVPSTGLARGATVQVGAGGFAPGSVVRLVQCDDFYGDPESDCADRTTTVAGADGTISAGVTLVDPVYRAAPFGDPTPVYCRADGCRLFAVGSDSTGAMQVQASDPLEFTGAPATIAVSPADGLRARQQVSVRGTALGAAGQRVRIVEHACFQLVQGSGCYGDLKAVTTRVGADGTYAARYPARRYLADGTDCAAPDILGSCRLSVTVLDDQGVPDDSFGVSRIGDPGAPLSFRVP